MSMEDDLERRPVAGARDEAIPESGHPAIDRKLIAPAWHTVLILLLVATASLLGAHGVKHLPTSTVSNNLPSYLASIAMEWALAALVFWGLWMRGTPLHAVLGQSRSGWKEWLADAGAGLAFWIIALMLLSTIAVALKPLHLHPENIRTTVSKLAPYTIPELIAWTALSITAGVCEEFIFRGYLQQQFTRISHRIWIGAAASAIIFGFSHGYEGLVGMLLITAFGALFSVFSLVRGNLRAGMMAHAWHDFLSGMVLSFIAHHNAFSLGS